MVLGGSRNTVTLNGLVSCIAPLVSVAVSVNKVSPDAYGGRTTVWPSCERVAGALESQVMAEPLLPEDGRAASATVTCARSGFAPLMTASVSAALSAATAAMSGSAAIVTVTV